MSTSDADARLASRSANVVSDDRLRKLPQPQLDWKFFTPLIWAPTFPIIRMSTKNMQTSSRTAVIGVAILVANLHGFWLINNPDLSDEALGIKR